MHAIFLITVAFMIILFIFDAVEVGRYAQGEYMRRVK